MLLADAAETTTVAIDPTVLALLSIFGGVVLTLVAGFFGAWLQSRREHEKWIRERRYDAFVQAKVNLREMQSLTRDLTHIEGVADAADGELDEVQAKEIGRIRERFENYRDQFASATEPLAILGPKTLYEIAGDVRGAIQDEDEDAIEAAETRFIAEARRALSIKD